PAVVYTLSLHDALPIFQAVGGGGLDDADAHRRLAVAAVVGAALGGLQRDPGDVAQPHHVAVGALGDRHLRELRGVGVVARHPQDEVAVGGLDATRAQFHVLRAQGALNVAGGQAARGQLVAIQPDPHRVALAAAHAHLGHALQAGEAVHQVALRVVGQLQQVHRLRAQVEPDDGVGIALDLADFRRVGLLRHAVGDPADRVADVVGGGLDVAAGVELDADPRAAVAAAGLDGVDALDAG